MARPKQKPPNPISTAIQEWLEHSCQGLAITEPAGIESLVAQAPKRWVTYEPMVLLPSGSFSSPLWQRKLEAVSGQSRDVLWRKILHNIGAKTPEKTTHLAVNDAIPLTLAAAAAGSQHCPADEANILRSPIGLRTLCGDFGPSQTHGQSVSDADFDQAFWATTKQNGIQQTWAPRWTMFSRGNVKEKTRLLAFHGQPSTEALAHRMRPQSAPPEGEGGEDGGGSTWAVDLYGGIGYFVFSYAKLGMRVLCWELNPWSVEGLRRGARANGWAVKVVKGEEQLRRPTRELVLEGNSRIVVFWENNVEAARRVAELRSDGCDLRVAHVNCGLLPRSDDSWEAAREILGDRGDGWLHLHENVGVIDIEGRKAEIQASFDGWDQRDGGDRAAKVEHVELVKTFAPDVWHCVFDVYITKSKSNVASRSA
ncbi:unnamed protein product [Discula destructiva]